MAATPKNRWVEYGIFGLSLFLVFCLLFDSYIELPAFVGWLGKWHPLLLHFPIVLLLIVIFLGLTGRSIPKNLLLVAVVSTLLTAISGFFLGKDGGAKGELLQWHQWLGGALALLAVFWYALYTWQLGQKAYTKVLQVAVLVLVGFTGHYGGMVTHGEDFLALPKPERPKKLPENPLIYEDVVGMILDNNCVSCHNTNKQKGGLLMTNLGALLKGGDVGNTVVPGDAGNSELIKRLHLPKDDKEHMPPDGKKPLNENEVRILERWIALGASDTLRLNDLEEHEPLVALIEGLTRPDPMEKWAKLPPVADSTLQNLSSDYVTINRMANGARALSVSAFNPPEYDSAMITDLKQIATNIVALDISGLPVGSDEIAFAALCVNLEWLEVDQTPITDAQVASFKTLTNLELLKIYGTQIGDQSIAIFKGLTNLKRLYLWQTGITETALNDLQQARPNLLIDTGIDEGTRTFFAATDSISKTTKE